MTSMTITHQFSFSGQLTQTEYPDVFLTTADGGGRVVPAHRVVLASMSAKLYTLCEKGGRMLVRNISYVVLDRMVRLIYMGYVKVSSTEEVEDLRDGMDMLKVKMNITESEMNASGEYFETTFEENAKHEDAAETQLFMEENSASDDHNNSLPKGHDSNVKVMPSSNLTVSENILNVLFKKGSQFVINDAIKKVSIPKKIVRRKARPSRSPWILKCPSPCSSLSVECSSDSSDDSHSDAEDIMTEDNVPPNFDNNFFAPESKKYPDHNHEATTSKLEKKKEPLNPNLVPMPEEITISQLERVCKVGESKVYCKRSGTPGTTCHQCRNKTTDTKTVCRSGKCVGMRGQFCGPCLQLKYGEDAREALMLPGWKCPPCRNICSCTMCHGRDRRKN